MLDVKRKMTDMERKNFLSVQGRDSQKQFSTYFGEVKNHVLSQLFLQGIKGQEAEDKAKEVLFEIFKGGFITDEMYVVSKLQELGYLIDNAFTDNSQTFAGVVYDAYIQAIGKGEGLLFKAFGGASDTQGKSVQELSIQEIAAQDTEKHIDNLTKALQQSLDITNLRYVIIEAHSELVKVRVRVKEGLGAFTNREKTLEGLLNQAIDRLMSYEGANKVKFHFDEVSWVHAEDRINSAQTAYSDGPQKGLVREIYMLEASRRGLSQKDTVKRKQVSGLISKAKAKLSEVSDNQGTSSSPIEDQEVGGIDFNPINLNMLIKRDGKGVPVPVSQQPIINMRIDGLLPTIINVIPITNVQLLLGFADHEKTDSPDYLTGDLKARELEEISYLN